MLVFLALSMAAAQDALPVLVPEINAQLYHPPADSRATLWTEDTSAVAGGGPIARLVFGYVHEPFVFVSDDGERVPLLSHATGFNLIAGYGLDRFRASLDLPVFLSAQTKSGAASDPGGAGLGDIGVDLKFIAMNRDDGVGLGGTARVTLPTGNVGSAPISDAKPSVEVGAVVDDEVAEGAIVAANFGIRGMSPVDMGNVTFGSAVFFRVGGGYAINDIAGVSADLAGQVGIADFGNGASIPVEGMLGGWGEVAENWVVRGGVGTGLTRGIGAPVARVVFGIGYEPPGGPGDTDLDGLTDDVDSCPLDAEDPDNFEDVDGCPELDNDKDGIADATDKCPIEPEDVDSWDDSDGCHDLNTHIRLRVFDTQSGKPLEGLVSSVTGPATGEGDDDFELDLPAGAYTINGTLAGYLPLESTFEVTDGPPIEQRFTMQLDVVPGKLRLRVTDPGGNPIPAATFMLNDNPPASVGETGKKELTVAPGGYVLMVRAEGFAPSTFPATIKESATSSFNVVLQPARVVITKEKLDIKDKIFFETGKAIIKPESFKLLDELALILLDHPEILMVRIEGHTDSRGNDSDNLRLSQARADSVKAYFVDKGVEDTRLTALGLGETRPLDTAENTTAYDKNRRVEFFIEKRVE